MSIIDKIYEKIGYLLINTNNPKIFLCGLYILEKNHNYVEKDFIDNEKILKILRSFEKAMVTGTGVLMVFYKDKVIKYPLGKRSIQSLNIEYTNYLLLQNTIYSNLVDYILEAKENYFVMEKLSILQQPISSYKKIYSQLSEIKKDDLNLLSIINPSNIKNVLIRSNVDKKDINSYLNYLNTLKCKSVPMHGDLTQYNIMLNKKNHLVLIDLDWFKLNGIEDIDRIHFIIEFYAKKRKKNYLELIIDILDTNFFSSITIKKLLVYFLYRINIEYNKSTLLRDSYYTNIFKIINNHMENL